LEDSSNADVQFMGSLIVNGDRGYEPSKIPGYIVAYDSLPPLTGVDYTDDIWKIVVIIPDNEIFKTFNETRELIASQGTEIRLSSFAILFVLLIVAILVSLRFSTVATRDVRTLAKAAQEISAKNYDVEVKLKSRDEIGQLGRVFENMASDIRDYTVNLEAKVAERTAELTEANEEIARLNEQLRGENLRLGAELDVARRLQMMVLPPDKETRRIPELDIASYMRPTDEVGGDYYDILRVGDALFICIGDVAGHGLPSGVIMLMAQTAMLTLSKSGERNMERMLSILNRVLYNNIQRIREDKNMTMAILQYKNREVSMVGQHESVLICRKDGSVQSVDTMDLGIPIGLQEDIDGFIMTSQLKLDPGDVMLLYTDGITESVNMQNELFGLEGLIASLKRCYKLTAEEIKEHILTDMFAHIGEAHIYDDIAMLVLKQK
jgi:sigma-B regulation protein RsbU (phosphoserine phosphatase)